MPKKRPEQYADEDHELLRKLYAKYIRGDPQVGFEEWSKLCEDFNAGTMNVERTIQQLKDYYRIRKEYTTNSKKSYQPKKLMPIKRKRPDHYTEEEHRILTKLITKYINPEKTILTRTWRRIVEEFNDRSTDSERTVHQIQGYYHNRRSKFAKPAGSLRSKEVETKKRKSGKHSIFTEEIKDELDEIMQRHGPIKKGYGNQRKYFRQVAEEYNSTTLNRTLTSSQILSYVRGKRKNPNEKPRVPGMSTAVDTLRGPLTEEFSSDIVCRNVRSLGSHGYNATPTSSTGNASYMADEPNSDDYRPLADDLPGAWEYTEIGCGYSRNPTPNYPTANIEEPYVYDDIIDMTPSHPQPTGGNGITQDLAHLLLEQTKQHHRMKMRLLKEEYRKMCEVYKAKMWMLEKQHEMKKKRHERKMEILQEEFRRMKEKMI